MGRFLSVLLVSILPLGLPAFASQQRSPTPAQSATAISPHTEAQQSPRIVVAANTKLQVVVTRPVWSRTAKAGDTLFGQTNFPLSIGGTIAVPAGTYVEGRIVSLIPPSRKSNRAELRVVLTKLIFANGYVVMSPNGGNQAISDAHTVDTHVTVQVGRENDLLLDNGSQFELTVGTALELNIDRTADAATQSRAPRPTEFRTATLCRPTPGSPGTPGTSDTVFPGSPGTPATVIPGANGAPDTVIPGIPATPPTVVPGIPATPDTPGLACPASPLVIASVPEAIASTK